jgi:hypothetical protein
LKHSKKNFSKIFTCKLILKFYTGLSQAPIKNKKMAEEGSEFDDEEYEV